MPPFAGPLGVRKTCSQVRGGPFGGRGRVGGVGRGSASWSWQPDWCTDVVPGAGSPLPGDPFVSRGAGSPPSHGVLQELLRPLASVCAFPRGHGLCGLLWQPPAFVGSAGSAPGWGATCWPGVGAGRGGGNAEGVGSSLGTRNGPPVRGLGFLGWRAVSPPPSPPPPATVASLCAAGEGTERESYFSKLLSCCSLPCESCGGREGCERLGPGDFPEYGAAGASSGRPLPKAPPFPSSRACPQPHPHPCRPGSRPARGPGAGTPLWRPGRWGGGEPPAKLLCHCPARRSRPGGAARTRATRAWALTGSGGAPLPRRASPTGGCANLAAQKTTAWPPC